MKLFKIIYTLILATLFLSACQKEEYELGRMLSPSEIDFEVEQLLSVDPGGNTVVLRNNTPGTIAMWDYGTGKSTRTVDTVNFAFEGEYTIKFSALTAGGVVEMEPVTIQVTQNEFKYVNDPMWLMLTGGPGQEKTWLLDLDANGVSKYFTSPVYFSSNTYDPNTDCISTGACWLWEPEWAGNQWIGDKGDYGTMTFKLINGPFVTVDHKMIPSRGVENGTYSLNAATGILSMTGAAPLQNSWASNDIGSWNQLKVISITEDAMQLAAWHKSKEEFMIFNYISKEYADNWVPSGPAPDPNFDHGGDQGDILAVDKTPSRTWKLDLQVPYNWTNLQGEFLNNWSSRADIMATGWAPYGDADVQNIDNASINFHENGTVVVTQDNGTTVTGTYTIDEATNIVKFEGVKPTIPVAGWVTATTTADNEWKIVKVERSPVTNQVTGIWFGMRDPNKSEYMVFHFVIR